MTLFLFVTLFVLFEAKVVRLREKLHNGMQPLRNNKQYQIKQVISVHSYFGRRNKIKKLFPSVTKCTVAAYDCLNNTSKGQAFTLHNVYFREIPRIGAVYTARRKKKFARIFFEEKILEQKK